MSEPEVKFIFLVLSVLGALAVTAKSEAVLPAYLFGLVVAGIFVHDKVLVNRMRAIAFALLTPFFFIKAGVKISAPALLAGFGLMVVVLLIKVMTKYAGVWPACRVFRIGGRESHYTTLLMSTGLTFGSISALYGLTHGIIDQAKYSILVSAVIASAVVPTIIAQVWFQPRETGSRAKVRGVYPGTAEHFLHTPEE